MRFRVEILAVETTGDTLKITGQADELAASADLPWKHFVFEVSDTPPHRRAYHVGRSLNVSIKPERDS